MFSLLLLGFSSGLPLPLVSSTLQAFLTEKGENLSTIGLFTLASLPYTIKFLWSPFLDRFLPPFLGKRKGWIFLTQLSLITSIPFLPKFSFDLLLLGGFTIFIAFVSASQDIVIDALRTEILKEEERGAGAAVFILGYRVALLTSGAIALIVSRFLGWSNTYALMASLLFLGVIGCLLSEEINSGARPQDMKDAFLGPLKDLFSKKAIFAIFTFLVLYKLGDAYIGAMNMPFLLRGIGFSAIEVGTINKGVGFFALILGTMLAGGIMMRVRVFSALLLFGFLQMISNLLFLYLFFAGKDIFALFITIFFENFSGGMGTAAFVSLIMALCNPRYSATQFAILSSLSALGRVFVTPTSGFFVEEFGWPSFFIFSTLLALPGLLVLLRIRRHI